MKSLLAAIATLGIFGVAQAQTPPAAPVKTEVKKEEVKKVEPAKKEVKKEVKKEEVKKVEPAKKEVKKEEVKK
jgi:hypothetical protein